jgi:hypothetical protein
MSFRRVDGYLGLAISSSEQIAPAVLTQARMYSALTIKVMARQLGLDKPYGFLDRVLGLGWIWLCAQSLGWMVGLSPREEEPNQSLFNLSLLGGLAGGEGGAGKKWFAISDGWQPTNPSIPLLVVQPLKF